MSTRGCVAVGTLEKWIGCYNHRDSYPTSLGCEVWKTLQVNPNFLEELLEHDDWRSFLAGGICEFCGKKRGRPHSIRSGQFPNGWSAALHGTFPDPEAMFHMHYEGSVTEYQIYHDDADPLMI